MADLSLDLSAESKGTGAERDLVLINGDAVLTADVDAQGTNPILQDVSQRLRFFQGEWFLETSQGVPYFQEILIKDPELGQVDAILQNTVLATPGVLQLADYRSEFDRVRRRLSAFFVIVTQLGTVDYTLSLATEGGAA